MAYSIGVGNQTTHCQHSQGEEEGEACLLLLLLLLGRGDDGAGLVLDDLYNYVNIINMTLDFYNYYDFFLRI